eukprot:2080352-Alexandrium_andersonii.AAC.1
MSASLVGSEMCIRDSVASTQRGGSESVASFSEIAGEAPDIITALSPVSYTHLTLPTICSV